MNVLFCGGVKTNNIVSAISKSFESGSVDFIVEPFIEDVVDTFMKGNIFDRAIIIEQGWTHDNEDEDEYSVREKINKFASDMANRGLEASFIFLNQTDIMASIVDEEILPIKSDSIILVKQPKYYVNFFVDLVTKESGELDEYIYKPANEDYDEPTDEPTEDINKLSNNEFGTEEQEKNTVGDIKESDFDDFKLLDETVVVSKDTENTEFNDPEFGETVTVEQPKNDSLSDFDFKESDFDFKESDFDNIKSDNAGLTDTSINEGKELKIEPNIFDDITDFRFDNESTGDSKSDNKTEETIFSEVDIKSTYSDENNQTTDITENVFEGNEGSKSETTEFEITQKFFEATNDCEINQSDNTQTYKQNYKQEIDDSEQNDNVATTNRVNENVDYICNNEVRSCINAVAKNGCSIVVTGCGGCGTSTVSMNLANVLWRLGYTILLVDLDTKYKAQSYITKDHYESIDPDSAPIMSAINSSSGINAYVSVVKQGYHLLTMGMASDSVSSEKALNKDKLSRFITFAKMNYNFVIYDVPFENATTNLDDIIYSADNIILNIDSSTWGINKTLIAMCNIDNPDIQETLFTRTQLLYNKFRGIDKLNGKKVKNTFDIAKIMDKKVESLLGEDPGYHFSNLRVCGVIQDNPGFEKGWFNEKQISDTKNGFELFRNLLVSIVLRK